MLNFHHIPKTGGTSIIRAISNIGLIHQAIRPENKTSYEPMIYPSTGLLSSHWYFDNHWPDGKHFTILRHPVDMFFSFYFYIKNRGKVWDYNPRIKYQTELVLSCDTIEDYIMNGSPWKYPRYQFEGLEKLDFVGTIDRPERTIEWLESVGVDIVDIPHVHKGEYKIESNQWKSLTDSEILLEEIKIYNQYCYDNRNYNT